MDSNVFSSRIKTLFENNETDVPDHISMREVILKEGMLMPTPGARYVNLDPSFTRHQDSLTSTDRRIHQGADLIHEAKKERISETRDSQMKCISLIPELKNNDQMDGHYRKPKAYLNNYSSEHGSCPFYSQKFPFAATSTSYRNIMQAADLISSDTKPRSVTYTDFQPKVLYPFKSPPKASTHSLKPAKSKWMNKRKRVSHFSDVEVPKRDGYYKFIDDDKTTF